MIKKGLERGVINLSSLCLGGRQKGGDTPGDKENWGENGVPKCEAQGGETGQPG